MKLRSSIVFVSLLGAIAIPLSLRSVQAQTQVGRCDPNDSACGNQINPLVDQSYQQYRTPTRIIQKQVSDAETACLQDRPSDCDNLSPEIESRQSEDTFRQRRETQQTTLDESFSK